MPRQQKHSDTCKKFLKDSHKNIIRCRHNLVAVKTSRSILDREVLLLQSFKSVFIQRLADRKVDALTSNPAVDCWPRGTLCLGIAPGWKTTLAVRQRGGRVAENK